MRRSIAIAHAVFTLSVLVLLLFITFAVRQKMIWHYEKYIYAENPTFTWMGTRVDGTAPRMRAIVFTSDEPFAVEIGWELDVWLFGKGLDTIGFMVASPQQDGTYRAVLHTYMGRRRAVFWFDAQGEGEVRITDQELGTTVPDLTLEPHWYQKYLGIWG